MTFSSGTSRDAEVQMSGFSTMQEAPGSVRTVRGVTHAAQQIVNESEKIHKKLVVASATAFFMSAAKIIDIALDQYEDISLGGVYANLERFKEHFRVHKKAFEIDFLPNTNTYIEDFLRMLTGIENLIGRLPSDSHVLKFSDKMKVELNELIAIARKSVNR